MSVFTFSKEKNAPGDSCRLNNVHKMSRFHRVRYPGT